MSIISYTYTPLGIMIDHDNHDLSAAHRDGVVEVGIGENYSGAEGYERWIEINLTMDEARAFRDWLNRFVS